MKSVRLLLIAFVCVLIGIFCLYVYVFQPVTAVIDRTNSSIKPHWFGSDQIIYQATAWINNGDQVLISRRPFPGLIEKIIIQHAYEIRIWADGKMVRFSSFHVLPANLLLDAGIHLFPGDQIIHNSIIIPPDKPLAGNSPVVLQVQRSYPIILDMQNNKQIVFSSNKPTLASALWDEGVTLYEADLLSPSPSTPLNKSIQAKLRKSIPVRVEIAGHEVHFRSGARTVDGALLDAGISLQNLDYSIPSESEPVPQDGVIKLIQVRENLILEQEPQPFTTSYEPVSDLEIDSQKVIRVGAYGLTVRRIRVRTENGLEVSRTIEDEWISQEPVPRIVGFGTGTIPRVLNTPDGSIEYWRAVKMYATSYSPCNLGVNRCGTTTYSGAELKKGIAAVIRSWYPSMAGSRVYIPGYGYAVIADIGGGISGRHWIDLGYSDEDYISWHSWVTVYFLTPVPSGEILWILP